MNATEAGVGGPLENLQSSRELQTVKKTVTIVYCKCYDRNRYRMLEGTGSNPGGGWRGAVEAGKNVGRNWWQWMMAVSWLLRSSLSECVGHDRVDRQGRSFQEKEIGLL